ncbi:hypothetical protein A2U01_0086846, partial [Trifolium medium]|nr:hypothetical protein [Trifolium medium]
LCKEKGVPDYPGDERLYPIKALPMSQFTGYSKNTVPAPVADEQGDGGASEDEMNQFEDGTHPQQQQPQFQQHSDDEIAALMTQL